MRTIKVATPDGSMPVHVHMPVGDGSWPNVILFMDGPGIRPAVQEIAARLAGHGYVVALPDLFHRAGPYSPVDPKVVFTDPALKADHRARLMATATAPNAMTDTRALLDAMAAWPEVADGPCGAVGYCMGGRLALIAAATFPGAFAAVASFHAGGLADDRSSSLHLVADRLRARVYVAGAIDDVAFPDDMKDRLASALAAAGVDHEVTTYLARHGWVPRDAAAHDPAKAERHWRALTALMGGALGLAGA